MMMPGDTWFLTLTTAPASKRPVFQDYMNFWKYYWRKNYPAVAQLWIETSEGLGVIHSLLRFPHDSPVPTQKEVQEEWDTRHQAFSTWRRPKSKGKLANYCRQTGKNLLAGEMKKQSCVIRWNYSRNWICPGFLKVWGRAWTDTLRLVPECERPRVIADWILACSLNPLNLDTPPIIDGNFIKENYYDV
jgi:hypothetical protein